MAISESDTRKAGMTSSKRKRLACKRRLNQTQASKDEGAAQNRNRVRARAERRLLEDTKATHHRCGLKSHRIKELNQLFGKKDLPATKDERDYDDLLRRYAVEEIMQAREAAGWEVVGEAARWKVGAGQTPIDIPAEINAKFDSKFYKDQQDRLRKRKTLRKWLEWNIQQPNRAGIPHSSIQWLRERLNDSVAPPGQGHELIRWQNSHMQAVYYIFACRRRAGYIESAEPTPTDMEPQHFQRHLFLMTQEEEYFKHAYLVSGDDCYDIEVDLSDHMTTKVSSADKKNGGDEAEANNKMGKEEDSIMVTKDDTEDGNEDMSGGGVVHGYDSEDEVMLLEPTHTSEY